MKATDLTQEQLKQQFHYNPETGVFIRVWVSRACNKRFLNKEAGYLCRGYYMITINGIQQYAHRLAWLYEKGEWPYTYIQHKNREKADNRFSNLKLGGEPIGESVGGKPPTANALHKVRWGKQGNMWITPK